MIKKAVVLSFVLLISGVVFGQEFTFQGLPWGASKEQVIRKFGNPVGDRSEDSYSYLVSVHIFNSTMYIEFDDLGMCAANYRVRLGAVADSEAWELYAFNALLDQLQKKYGPHSELIVLDYTVNSDRILVWHFNNFHIVFAGDRNTDISYLSDRAWNIFYEQMVATAKALFRRPNMNL